MGYRGMEECGTGLGGDGDLVEADGMSQREEKRQEGTGWKGGHNQVSWTGKLKTPEINFS